MTTAAAQLSDRPQTNTRVADTASTAKLTDTASGAALTDTPKVTVVLSDTVVNPS